MSFKAPNLLPHDKNVEEEEKGEKIGMVTSQKEGLVENIDDVETTEVEAEKKSKISIQAPILKYEPPPWACQPDENDKFQFEIMKEGKIIGHYDLKKRQHDSFIVIGRIKPGCDLLMEHPSISRYHCILQYGDDRMSKTGKGWHIYEMGSTHGTRMNKNRLPPKQYIRVRVGFLFQFGESTRMYNLLGPETDSEPEWECSPTEMKLKYHRKVLEAKLKAAEATEEQGSSSSSEAKKKEEEEDGCGWGMDYGEDEKPLTTTTEMDAHLMEDREAYYNQDPKKALAKFFEREGFDMNFEFGEQGQGHTHKWVCSIELPVEIDGVDRAFTASATVSTSKKDAQTQCALEACRILDTYNVLRRTNTKMRMKRKTLEDNDYYDEDDDLYFDRTGQLEAQREKRKQWAEEGTGGQKKTKNETYETLCQKLEETKKEMAECQQRLDALGSSTKRNAENLESADSLDDYVRQMERNGGLGDDAKTKTEKSKWRQKLVAATHEFQKLEKLVKIAEPVKLSGLQTLSATSGDKQAFLRKLMAAKKAKKEEKPVVEKVETPKIEKEQEKEIPKIEKQAEKEIPKVEKKEEPPLKIQKVEIDEPSEEPKKSQLQQRVSQWEEEMEAEKEAEKEKKRKQNRTRKRDVEKKVGGAEEYGVGCDDREEKYTTWMPKEDSESKQDALRAKFAGKY